MRRIGFLAILHYLAYFAIGVCILSGLSGTDMYDNIAAGLFMMLALFCLIFGGVGLLLKLLQLITRLPLFGALCMLFDLHGIAGWIVASIFFAGIIPAEYLSYMVVIPVITILAAALSLISNASALRG